MTSNIGSSFIQDWDGQNFDKLENTLHGELNRHFRPEFINRIDDIVIFDRIQPGDMSYIVEVQLSQMLAQLKKSKDLQLEFTDKAKYALAEQGYDKAFGARPLKRIIQKRILDKLAKEIISGNINEGNVVQIDFQKDHFTLTTKK